MEMNIKNAKDLTPRQWYLFLKLVTKYYKTSVLESNKNPILNKMKMRFFAEGNAEHTLARIKNGSLVSYVYLTYDAKEDGPTPIAFTTGYVDDRRGLLRVCHLYVPEDNVYKARIVKALFTPLSRDSLENGVTRVFTTSDLLMPNLTDSLEILGLEQGEPNGTELPYGRGLDADEMSRMGSKNGKRIAFNRNSRRR